MRSAGPPCTYRDELVAAQARVATLEEQLATRDDGEEEHDPVIARLLSQRRTLERTASRHADWQNVLLVVLTPPVVVLVLVAVIVDPANHVPVGMFGMGCVAMLELLVQGLYFDAPRTARLDLPRLDAKLAEARRLRAIDRGLRALAMASGSEARRAPVVGEEEVGETLADAEGRRSAL